MSSSIPLIFKPEFFEDTYIIDGAVGAFYPIKQCLDDGALKDEILGVKIIKPAIFTIRKDDTFLKYINSMICNLTKISSNNVSSENEEIGVPNLIVCKVYEPYDLELIITTEEKREELLKSGEKCAEEFLKGCMKELGE
jgi:predicted patatin/cPLA2 family phospholipase